MRKGFKTILNNALVISVFTVALLLCLTHAGYEAFAADPCTYVEYDSDGNASTNTITDYKEISVGTQLLTNGWYVVSSDVILPSRLFVSGNNVRIIIKDGVTLTALTGIRHAGDDVLFIYGQQNGSGSLIARGWDNQAGIGGNSGERGGTLNVHGVNIKAYGGKHAAGIGGGSGGAAGAFYSYAGSSYAEGGEGNDSGTKSGGAGIGGGYGGGEGYHQLYGGEVEAHGGRNAAGIGAGQGGYDGQLYIKNANVKAYGGFDAAGVGTGFNGSNGLYLFTMSGGTLYAQGLGGGAGIGGGAGSKGIRSTTINGGKITAVAGPEGITAIGHGKELSGNYNTEDGVMDIQADLMVRAGSSASDAKVIKTGRTEEKVSACHSNKYVEIEKCSHPSKTYTNTGNDTSHRWDCSVCGRIGSESHRPDADNKCICGASLSNIWIIQDGFYLIYNEIHWNKMCDMVDNNQCNQRKFRLMNDISVSRPAGVNATVQPQNTAMQLLKHCFNGTFDGNGHTLEFNYSGTTPSGYVAPFMVTRSATIMNIHITGSIHNTGKGEGGVGGLIGLSSLYGSKITNVRVSSTLRYDGSGNHVGGFIAGYFRENSGWSDEYKGCVFDGEIYSDSRYMTGFHAKDFNGAKAQMTDCLFIPARLGNHRDDSRTFSIIDAKSLSNCFYATPMGHSQESGSRQVYSVKSATDILSISYAGSPTVKYDASLYTRYGSIIDYNGTCYAPQGTSVTLKLTLSATEYADRILLNGSKAGVRNNGNGTYTFTMPAKNSVLDVERPFSVSFLNDDGSVFHTTEKFSGESLSAKDFPSGEPVKSSDDDGIKYTFDAWKYRGGDIPNVITESIDITPVFSTEYRVNFIRDDGTLIDRVFYPEGTKVSEIDFPETPTKAADYDAEGHYTYAFDHWDKSAETVTSETSYTAHYNTNRSEHDWRYSFDFSADHNWLTAKATCRTDVNHQHSERERVRAKRKAVWDDGANPCEDKGKWKYYVTTEDFSEDGFFYNSLGPTATITEYSINYDVEPLGHDWIIEEGTDEEGWYAWSTGTTIHKARECDRCGKTEEREYEQDHIHGTGVISFSNEVSATCTASGRHAYGICSCGDKFKAQSDGEVDWTTPVTDEDIIIDATGHISKDPVKRNETEATCTSSGSYEKIVYCERCGDAISSEYISTDALGHDWGAPTYEHNWDGGTVSATRICRRDEDHIEKETAQVKEEITKEPGCEEKGSKYYYADFENEAFERQESEAAEIEALGHNWDDGEITQEAGCTEAGIKTFKCLRCDKTKNQEIPKLEHSTYTVIDEDSNTATCTEAGSVTQREVCSHCGETITSTEVATEPLGHLFWDLTYEWADDMSAATAKHVCLRDDCNETESETVETTTKVIEENSCTTEGLIRYFARFENDAFEAQERDVRTNAKGHDWGDWKVIKEPTETSEGLEQRVCSHDPSHKQTREIAANATYRSVSGDGNIWYKGSGVTSDFTFKRSVDDASTFNHFTEILVDDKAVDTSKYVKESGSVIIKLKPEYLETLAIGEHKLLALFDDGNGSASAMFTVAEKEDRPHSDTGDDETGNNEGGGNDSDNNVSAAENSSKSRGTHTGDESNVLLWIALMLVSMIALASAAMVFKRNKGI